MLCEFLPNHSFPFTMLRKHLKMVVAYTIRCLTIIPGKLSLSFFCNEFQEQSGQWRILGDAENYQFFDNH
jgi:hypothetical protein